MSDQNSIFNDPNAAPPQNQNPPGNGGTPQDDDLATLLSGIKNERGEPKYKSVQDALKALQHSQEYIPTLKQTKEELEQKLAEAMTEVAKVKTLEQTVAELAQRITNAPTNTAVVPVDEGKIAELVNRTLTQAQQATLQRTNLQSVVAAVKTVYGDKAEEVFYNKANELGMSRDEFNAMAARSPKAVLSLIGVGENKSTTTAQGVNTVGFQPKPDSFIKRNGKSVLSGAGAREIAQEREASNQMVNELHAQGLSVHDLTDPKVYFKHF